ncbi:hypothetical protein HPP92_000306 [Vanilla planifolia]|uniref:Uncharacterized protein n=1 Tax=Vanilla planifolia TaxID=51239 RepID=A0A835S2L1_VANPL|nr:hypothetical protein HPP92_000282 [Vanilla planifolia]KAG0500234.1 hypothetical protein HPP92_000306 [Vanilla planifolia]
MNSMKLIYCERLHAPQNTTSLILLVHGLYKEELPQCHDCRFGIGILQDSEFLCSFYKNLKE